MRHWNPKDISMYDQYDQEQKMSICRSAFIDMCGDGPPHMGLFYLARTIGFEIPEQWKYMYPEMMPDLVRVIIDEEQIGVRITKGYHLGSPDIIDIMVYYPIDTKNRKIDFKKIDFRLEETFSIINLSLNEVIKELERMKAWLIMKIESKQ